MRNMNLKNQRGFTLIEFISVATLILIATAAVIAGVNSYRESSRGSDFQKLNFELLGNVNAYFAPDFDYTGFTTANLVDGKLAPASMRRGTGTTAALATPFGNATGSAGVGGDSIDGTTGRTDIFYVKYPGMPVSTCAKDVAPIANRSMAVRVETAVVKNLFSSTPYELRRVSNGTDPGLAEACGALTGATYTLTLVQQ